MAQKKQKANYKIFDTATGKYVSTGRSKSTWLSMAWALTAAEDYYYRKSFVIHEFPLNDPNVYTMEEARKIIDRQKEIAKLAKESVKIKAAYRSLMEEINEMEYELRMKRDELEEMKTRLR